MSDQSQTSDYLDPRQMGPVPQAVDMPGAPPAAAPQPSPPQPVSQKDIDSLISQHRQNSDQLVSTITKLGEERNKLLNQPSPRPPMPKYEDIPKPPQDNYHSVFKESQAGLIFTTLLGSLFSRQHGLAAMTAASGYMNGFQAGDKEKMDRERQKWQDSVDQVIKQNNVEHDRYEAVWNNDKLSMQDKQAKLSAIAASVGDAQTISSLKNGDMDFAFKLQQDRQNAAMKLYEVNQRYGEGGSGLTDEGIKIMVDQYLAGDKSVLQNLGRGAQGSKNIVRFRNALADTMQARGITGAQQASKMAEFAGYQAAQRVLSQRQANLSTASQELVSFAGPALAASERVAGGKWVTVNQIEQNWKKYGSDPDLREFRDRNAGLISAYAQVISRTGVPTVYAQERADELLNTADSQEVYERGVDTLISEADLAEKAPDIIRERMRNEFTGKGNPPMAGGVQTGPVKVQTREEADKLAPGTHYITPDGNEFVR